MKEKYFMAFGDVHGHYELMFEEAREWEKTSGKKLTSLLCVGDMDPIYHELTRDFGYELHCLENYVDKDHTSPYPIVMVAGNNDDFFAYKYGEIAPNIFSLGRSGTTEINGIRIGGISGVYRKEDFNKKHDSPWRQSYPWYTHYNLKDVDHMLSQPSPHIFLSHDWMTWNVTPPHGNYSSETFIKGLNPVHMFSGHFHIKAQEEMIGNTRVHRLNRVKKESKSHYKIIKIS